MHYIINYSFHCCNVHYRFTEHLKYLTCNANAGVVVLEKHSTILILAMQIFSFYWNVSTQPCKCLWHSTNLKTKGILSKSLCVSLYLSFYLTLCAYIYNIFCVLVYKKADLLLKCHVCFYTLDQLVKLYFLCIFLHNLLLMSKTCFSCNNFSSCFSIKNIYLQPLWQCHRSI